MKGAKRELEGRLKEGEMEDEGLGKKKGGAKGRSEKRLSEGRNGGWQTGVKGVKCIKSV